jgi:hypothetical protein
MEGLAGDVGTGIGGQKNHRPGKVLRYLDPAERDVFLELEKERTVVGVHRGVHGFHMREHFVDVCHPEANVPRSADVVRLPGRDLRANPTFLKCGNVCSTLASKSFG